MALVVKDRVKETTATTGTGTLQLSGAIAGFQSFTSALSNGDTTYYAIVESSTGAWEVGLGTFTSTAPGFLARTTILSSSNSGSAINLTQGAAEVFITQPAGKSAYFDASGNFNATTATSATTATDATNVALTTSTTSSNFKVPFANTTASTTGNYGLLQDSTATFTYNPSTNTLAVDNVSAVDVIVDDQIIHNGDTDTYMQFHAADQWRVVTGGSERLEVNNTAITTQYDFVAKTTGTDRFNVTGTDVIVQSALKEKYVALSGTTPSIDVDDGGAFSLTTSGNTTFTFAAFTTSLSCAFVLQLTAGGAHTITWPASVDWAGGSAPDAPASGETNIYVFWSRDGGTTWYGVLSSAAAA